MGEGEKVEGGEKETKHRKVLSHSTRDRLEAEEATVSEDQCAAME